jgi:hypothetical protein
MVLHRNGTGHVLPDSHRDVTLARWLDMFTFVRANMPEGLLKALDGQDPEDVDEGDMMQWRGNLVGWWLGFKYEEVQSLSATDRIEDGEIKELGVFTLYDHLSQFLYPPVEQTKVEAFTLDGKEFRVSAHSLDVSGNKVPLGTATYGEVEEAMSFASQVSMIGKGKADALPGLLAHLYTSTDTTVKERKELFRQIDMQTVWGCYFFLTAWLPSYSQRMVSYSATRVALKASDGFPSAGRLPRREYSVTSTQ